MSKNPTSKRLTGRKRFNEMVTPDEVHELYWNRGISIEDIAEMYKVSYNPVWRFCKKHGLFSKGKKFSGYSRILISNYRLASRQKELIFGTLLGDGCVRYFHSYSQYPKLALVHGIKQRCYLEWKARELEPFISSSRVYEDHAEAMTYAHPDFLRFHKLFYSSGEKVVPKDLTLLTPFAIAIWFCDDGCNKHHRNGSIEAFFATYSFSVSDCNRLANVLKSAYDIEAYVGTHHNQRRDYPELRMTSAGVFSLHKLIDVHIPDAMRYKALS